MNRVFSARGFFTVPDGTDVSPFLNATDVMQDDVPGRAGRDGHCRGPHSCRDPLMDSRPPGRRSGDLRRQRSTQHPNERVRDGRLHDLALPPDRRSSRARARCSSCATMPMRRPKSSTSSRRRRLRDDRRQSGLRRRGARGTGLDDERVGCFDAAAFEGLVEGTGRSHGSHASNRRL